MYLSDLADDIIFYNKYQDSYSFMVDMHGYAIWHPSYPRPRTVRATQFPTDIRHLEQVSGFDFIRSRLLSEPSGNGTIRQASSTADEDDTTTIFTYSWHRAVHFYVICLVTKSSNLTKMPVHLNHLDGQLYHPNDAVSIIEHFVPELVYHRIDLVPIPVPLCRHFKQLATMGTFGIDLITFLIYILLFFFVTQKASLCS